jgi:hypothetical protein
MDSETKSISWEEEGNIEQINYGGDVYITHSLNCPNCNVDLGEHYLNTLKEVETRAEERGREAGQQDVLIGEANTREKERERILKLIEEMTRNEDWELGRGASFVLDHLEALAGRSEAKSEDAK